MHLYFRSQFRKEVFFECRSDMEDNECFKETQYKFKCESGGFFLRISMGDG